MQLQLKNQYIKTLIPAVSLFLIFGLLRQLNITLFEQLAIPSELYSVVFVLSAITAIAGPLFFRTLFAHSMREQRGVLAKDFLLFQKKILWISLITPYFAFIAILWNFPKFYSAAIVLMALYAIYYYYPSRKRINFDQKIFRVQ